MGMYKDVYAGKYGMGNGKELAEKAKKKRDEAIKRASEKAKARKEKMNATQREHSQIGKKN